MIQTQIFHLEEERTRLLQIQTAAKSQMGTAYTREEAQMVKTIQVIPMKTTMEILAIITILETEIQGMVALKIQEIILEETLGMVIIMKTQTQGAILATRVAEIITEALEISETEAIQPIHQEKRASSSNLLMFPSHQLHVLQTEADIALRPFLSATV